MGHTGTLQRTGISFEIAESTLVLVNNDVLLIPACDNNLITFLIPEL